MLLRTGTTTSGTHRGSGKISLRRWTSCGRPPAAGGQGVGRLIAAHALALDREISPARSSRRRTLVASARTGSGPAGEPASSSDSAHCPSGPESTSAATGTEESTTVVTSDRHYGRPGCGTRPPGRPLPACGCERLATTRCGKAGKRSAAPTSSPSSTGRT